MHTLNQNTCYLKNVQNITPSTCQKCIKEYQTGVGSVKRRRDPYIMHGRFVKKTNKFVMHIHAMMQKILWISITMKLELFLLCFMEIELKRNIEN